MPWFRDARSLYAAIHDGRLKAGDYVLVYRDSLKSHAGPFALEPAPKPPYFRYVMTVDSKGGIAVFRVMPDAEAAPMPRTPVPPPQPWWAQFDTD